MRLLMIMLGSVLCAGIVMLTVHFWGLGQTYLPYDNHFFDVKGVWTVVPWDAPAVETAARDKDWILWANVYRQKQGVLFVAPSTETPNHIDREQPTTPSRPLLSDFLRQHSSGRILLNVVDNSMDIHREIDEILKSTEGLELAKERFIIQSDYNNVLTSIKELEPRLAYGSTVSDLMRLKTYDSLGLVAAAPFPGDVFVSGLTFATESPRAGIRRAINMDIANELHRRFKKLILGPILNKAEYDQAIRLGADGIITPDPNKIISEP